VQSEELLCAQLYLRQHGRTYDRAKTKAALTALGSSTAGRKLLLRYANELRDPLFIPWLIDRVEPTETEVEVGNAQWILEEITFCRHVSGPDGWRRWWKEHSAEDRGQWIATAVAEIKRLAQTNRQAAHLALEKAVYRWKDLDALCSMRQLVGQPDLASDLIGWINLSYHEYRRPDLEAMAGEIVGLNRSALEPWAVSLLELLDFIPHQERGWMDYVASSNFRF